MTKFNTAVTVLIVLALAMLIGGLLRSDFNREALAGENGSGFEWGLALSPFVGFGLLLLALAFGWHKFGRN